MKIGILGYGKMGKTIEKIALERGHQVVFKINGNNIQALNDKLVQEAAVVIEFTQPKSAVNNILMCFNNHVPVVVGTTGWYADFKKVQQVCEETGGSLLYATNFSIGVNLFFKLNTYLARLMKGQNGYSPSMTEIHHTEKLDAPSGTAISLAEGIIAENPELKGWENKKEVEKSKLPIESLRIDQVPGTHEIKYNSRVDEISIKHTAHNREGFALGAVVAAEWLAGKKGVFSMADVLNVNFS